MNFKITTRKLQILAAAALMLGASCAARAQVASHAPTKIVPALNAKVAAAPSHARSLDKPVARVNGVVLTERELLAEMLSMFPYARQHNGFPKAMEPQIRKGALEMIIFEELLYQEAQRRRMTVPAARVTRAEADFRKQFSSPADYQKFLDKEMNGSRRVLRERIRRSFLIDAILQKEVTAKAKVTEADAKAYYHSNPKRFEHGDVFHIQTISILPPNDSPDVIAEARKRAQEAIKAAKATSNFREFGLLAEKISDDDYRVKMGEHRPVDGSQLPPEVVKAALTMKPGQVSDLIQLGSAYTVFRLISYTPAGKTPFSEIKSRLQSALQRKKTEQVRSALGQKLREHAHIERL